MPSVFDLLQNFSDVQGGSSSSADEPDFSDVRNGSYRATAARHSGSPSPRPEESAQPDQLANNGSFSSLMQGSESSSPENVSITGASHAPEKGKGFWGVLSKLAPALILGGGAVGALKNSGSGDFSPWGHALEGVAHGYAGQLLGQAKEKHSKELAQKTKMVDLATDYLKKVPQNLDPEQFRDLIEKRSSFAQSLVDGNFTKVAKTGQDFVNSFLIHQDDINMISSQNAGLQKEEGEIAPLQRAAARVGEYDPNIRPDMLSKDPRARAELTHAQGVLDRSELRPSPYGDLNPKMFEKYLGAAQHSKDVEYKANHPAPRASRGTVDPRKLQADIQGRVETRLADWRKSYSYTTGRMPTAQEETLKRQELLKAMGMGVLSSRDNPSQTMTPPPPSGGSASGYRVVKPAGQ